MTVTRAVTETVKITRQYYLFTSSFMHLHEVLTELKCHYAVRENQIMVLDRHNAIALILSHNKLKIHDLNLSMYQFDNPSPLYEDMTKSL